MRGDHTVLVVEDEQNCREMYNNWLAGEYDLRMASDGYEAMLQFDTDVDVVLLDRRMAGPSGERVATEIKDRVSDCPIVMVTALQPEPGIATMDIDDYLTKPVTGETLRSAIERVTARTTYVEELDSYYALAAKKAALEAELSSESLAINDQYAQLCRRLREAQARVESALADAEVDWTETFRACTADTSDDALVEVA